MLTGGAERERQEEQGTLQNKRACHSTSADLRDWLLKWHTPQRNGGDALTHNIAHFRHQHGGYDINNLLHAVDTKEPLT
jgi:hypothetical protein